MQQNNRSQYDNNMNTAWQYNTQPWPGDRTQQDTQLQQKFCGRCPNSGGAPPQQVERYEPLYGFRTPYDMELQSRWCGTICREPGPMPIPVGPIPVGPIPPNPYVRSVPISGVMPPVYNYACNRDHSSGGANSYASY